MNFCHTLRFPQELKIIGDPSAEHLVTALSTAKTLLKGGKKNEDTIMYECVMCERKEFRLSLSELTSHTFEDQKMASLWLLPLEEIVQIILLEVVVCVE